MNKKYKITERQITDYKPDPHNPNKHRLRGASMVERSLEQYGGGRSLVADSNDIILAGNQTQQSASDLGITDVIEIETDGNALVVVKRRDMDLLNDPKRAREYSIADNRSSEVGLEWDTDQLGELIEQGQVNIDQFFYDWEQDKLFNRLEDQELDYAKEWQDMPEFEQNNLDVYHTLKVHFLTIDDFRDFATLIGQNISEKTKYIYHPKQQKEDLIKLRIVDDES